MEFSSSARESFLSSLLTHVLYFPCTVHIIYVHCGVLVYRYVFVKKRKNEKKLSVSKNFSVIVGVGWHKWLTFTFYIRIYSRIFVYFKMASIVYSGPWVTNLWKNRSWKSRVRLPLTYILFNFSVRTFRVWAWHVSVQIVSSNANRWLL